MTTGYFNNFPYVLYDLTGDKNNDNILVKNIFFRFHILNSALDNTLVYYDYYVNEGETPETIAYRYYKDVTKHWVVMMANKIVDPHYDWTMNYNAFINYIVNKYDSIANAQTTIYGYTQSVQKQDSVTGNITTNTFNIDLNTYVSTPQFAFQEINLQDGTTVAITTTTNIVFNFDYEYNQNEAKKNIILIDKTYIAQIDQEFSNLTS